MPLFCTYITLRVLTSIDSFFSLYIWSWWWWEGLARSLFAPPTWRVWWRRTRWWSSPWSCGRWRLGGARRSVWAHSALTSRTSPSARTRPPPARLAGDRGEAAGRTLQTDRELPQVPPVQPHQPSAGAEPDSAGGGGQWQAGGTGVTSLAVLCKYWCSMLL